MDNVLKIARLAKEASIKALSLSKKVKNHALLKIADLLSENKEKF